MDKRLTKDLMPLDLNEIIDQLAKAISVRWYGHVLRKDENKFLRRVLDFRVKGTRNGGIQKKTWLTAVVEQSIKIGLNECDVNNCSRWRLRTLVSEIPNEGS